MYVHTLPPPPPSLFFLPLKTNAKVASVLAAFGPVLIQAGFSDPGGEFLVLEAPGPEAKQRCEAALAQLLPPELPGQSTRYSFWGVLAAGGGEAVRSVAALPDGGLAAGGLDR